MQNLQINNNAILAGIVSSELSCSHEVYGEVFYNFVLNIPRLSGNSDNIVITASEQFLHSNKCNVGNNIYISGQFRSYNNYSQGGNRLILTVFAKDIECADGDCYINEIILNGFICKPPIYRTTPFGREITDLLVAVNRTYNKSDYIPCIAWGRNAKFAGTLCVGDKIMINGRIQSREYQKKIDETLVVTKTAYEISISKISIEGS